MGPVPPPGNGLRLPCRLSNCILGLPQRRTQTRRESCSLLHKLLYRLLRLQPDNVDRRRSNLPTLKGDRREQRHVGMVLRPEHPRRDLPQQRRLRPPLPPPRLGPSLRNHRSRHRSPNHNNLRCSLLPHLEQAQAHEINGYPR